jgi:hypothetical protein
LPLIPGPQRALGFDPHPERRQRPPVARDLSRGRSSERSLHDLPASLQVAFGTSQFRLYHRQRQLGKSSLALRRTHASPEVMCLEGAERAIDADHENLCLSSALAGAV